MICHLFSNISDEAPASSLNSAAAPAAVGLAIQRPHSALHTGNFSADAIHPHPNPQLSAPSPGSWNGVAGSSQPIGLEPLQTNAFPTRRRSSVYRNSLVFMPPTSPLAQSASPDDIVDRLPLSLGQIALSGPMASKSGQSPELRPHVTLPFHAVFYDYPSKARDSRGAGAGSGGIADDGGPSPYVGTVDLENSLLAYGAQSQQKTGDQRRKKPKAHSEDTATRAPPGGSYRIPEVGQLQIIIKNPHKTAIKLFLVPYDLTGMQPGTKTFVRQRCYSLGPPASPIAPGGSGQASGPPQAHNRPVLRYLVHANICCPAKGRFYLYKDLRLVFANRVPDSHEKLRTEMTSPEPRFSAYRPTRSSALGTVRSTKARHGRTRSYGDVLQTLTRLGDGGGDHGVDMRSPQDAHLGSKTYADAVESPSETSPSILPEASKTWEYQKLSLDKVSSRVSSPAPQSLLSWGLWSMNSVQGEEDKKEKVDNAPA
ncbi:Protein FAM214A [Ceratocystis platani]|uniref:Protein FAM214A n=1 Tax=Ceratocystis fimbriata f. sp. platani TaxID=88771 RepID=A0A0F8B704_CERFI|nr:Protein FAM214A [Ceratocystis platani]